MDDPWGGVTPGDSLSFMPRGNPATGRQVSVVALAFDLVRVDMPMGSIQHSKKVWNHIDGLRVEAGWTARLVRNGLRIGVASSSMWPTIRAVLDAAGAELGHTRTVAQANLPLTIELGALSKAESIFSYANDGRLTGRTFSAGDKLLTIDYAFHPERGGSTDLRLSFEVRLDRSTMTWENRAGVIGQAPAFDRHVFEELSGVVTLKPNEFLIIALSERAENEHLVGSRLLSFKRAGKRYETMLCVTPQPFQTRGVKRRRGG